MDPVSLILAGVAIFFVYKLISVLGARTGHEQRQEIEGLQRATKSREKDGAADARAEARPPAPVSSQATPLREVDPTFDERAFLEGAKGAYEMVVEAFAAADLKSVRQLLAASVHDAFKRAIAQREAAGQRIELKFVGIDRAAIRAARVESGAMFATVDFSSNQVRTTYGRDGVIVDGDPNRVDLVRDAWTFSRPVNASDPNWTLVGTGAPA